MLLTKGVYKNQAAHGKTPVYAYCAWNAYYGQGQEHNEGKHKNQANLGGQVTARYFLNLHLCSVFELNFKIVYPYP